MSDALRRATIRLANEKPELRKHLLPVLAEDKSARKLGPGVVEVESISTIPGARIVFRSLGSDYLGETDPGYYLDISGMLKKLHGAEEMSGSGLAKAKKTLATLMKRLGSSEDKESRFEEGKPADPTKNMSPEDKAEWEKQKALHKDEFKSAGKGKVPEAFKEQWKNDDKDGDGKKNEPKPDFLKKKAHDFNKGDRVQMKKDHWTGRGSRTGTVKGVSQSRVLVTFDDGTVVDVDSRALEASHDKLRAATIRLAHENPALRPHLLQILAGDVTAAVEFEDLKAGMKVRHPFYTGEGKVTMEGGKPTITWENGDVSHPQKGSGMMRKLRKVGGDGREAGCEKLPAGPMRENCEKGGPNGKGKDKDDKGKDDGKMPAELLEKFKKKKKAAGPDARGRGWQAKSNPTRWVWSGTGDDPAFTVVEKTAPFGSYYKLQILLPDGTMLQTHGQKDNKEHWFGRAAKLYKAWGSAAGFDLSRQPERWNRMADFDPEIIDDVHPGGALEDDGDEPYMEEHFTQQEHSELGQMQEHGKLRAATIRLAHENPALRPHLLQILASDFDPNDMVEETGKGALERESDEPYMGENFRVINHGELRKKQESGKMPHADKDKTASDLRAATIRLAHENPALREHLLPLLKD